MDKFESGRFMADPTENESDAMADEPPKDSDAKHAIVPPEPKKEMQAQAERFVEQYRPVIDAYLGAGGIPITTNSGGWYANMETDRPSINVDASEFLERGFSDAESLFSTFHELEHILDMVEDPRAFGRFNAHAKAKAEDVHPAYPKALHTLYNCLDDVHVNKKVMARWKAGIKSRDAMYPKLFPKLDYRGKPRHRQLMYTILAESQRPDQTCLVDDEVREAIDAWQKRGGSQKSVDVINAVDRLGRPKYKMGERYARIQVTLEPIFEQFYKQDLDEGELGEGQGEEDPFGVDTQADAMPSSISPKDAEKIAKAFNNAVNSKKNDEFKKLMGVEKSDFEKYQKDVYAAERHIEELSKVFERVIQRRKEYRRILRRPTKEGILLDPRKAATAVAEIKSGNLEPQVMLDFEKKETVREKPNRLEFTLVCDGSGSMDEVKKKRAQQMFAVLAMEAFAVFRERIAKERRIGNDDKLNILTELRMFSDKDKVIKPLSGEFNHEDRVRLHKQLHNLPSGGNNEPATFSAIEKEQFGGERIKALQEGELKKIIVFLTDGETDANTIQAAIGRLHNEISGATGEPDDNLVVAGIGFAEGKSAVDTYRPNGHYANEFEDMPVIFGKIIEEVLDEF